MHNIYYWHKIDANGGKHISRKSFYLTIRLVEKNMKKVMS